jgi:hypothetical protein
MPQYTCSAAICPTNQQPFTLTSSGQTFCPRCNTPGSLTAYVAPPQIVERMEVLTLANPMSKTPSGSLVDCGTLIGNFMITLVSDTEASTPSDYIVKLGKDKNKRIDRQGPVTVGTTVTMAGLPFSWEQQ